MKKPPTGRIIRVVVDPAQQQALSAAAHRANLPLATWVRVVALQAAGFTHLPIHYPKPTNTKGPSD